MHELPVTLIELGLGSRLEIFEQALSRHQLEEHFSRVLVLERLVIDVQCVRIFVVRAVEDARTSDPLLLLLLLQEELPKDVIKSLDLVQFALAPDAYFLLLLAARV
jgi:hypothetical protein